MNPLVELQCFPGQMVVLMEVAFPRREADCRRAVRRVSEWQSWGCEIWAMRFKEWLMGRGYLEAHGGWMDGSRRGWGSEPSGGNIYCSTSPPMASKWS